MEPCGSCYSPCIPVYQAHLLPPSIRRSQGSGRLLRWHWCLGDVLRLLSDSWMSFYTCNDPKWSESCLFNLKYNKYKQIQSCLLDNVPGATLCECRWKPKRIMILSEHYLLIVPFIKMTFNQLAQRNQFHTLKSSPKTTVIEYLNGRGERSFLATMWDQLDHANQPKPALLAKTIWK